MAASVTKLALKMITGICAGLIRNTAVKSMIDTTTNIDLFIIILSSLFLSYEEKITRL